MENPEGDMEMEKQLLEELMELAKGGMGADLKKRYGKEEPAADLEAMPEDPEIPGVQTSAQDGEEPLLEGEGQGEGGGLDEQKLRALLASMKASGGGPAV